MQIYNKISIDPDNKSQIITYSKNQYVQHLSDNNQMVHTSYDYIIDDQVSVVYWVNNYYDKNQYLYETKRYFDKKQLTMNKAIDLLSFAQKELCNQSIEFIDLIIDYISSNNIKDVSNNYE